MSQEATLEQRARRSEDPRTAMRFQVEQVMTDFGLDACVVADEHGAVIAAPGNLPTELSTLLARATHDEDATLSETLRRFLPDRLPSQVLVREFRSLGERLFVAAVGASHMERELGSFRTIFGVRRIQDSLG